MRTSVLTRRLTALAVGMALATSMLSTPAIAGDSTTVSAAALPRVGELDAYGEADWQRLAQQACNAPGATPEVDSVSYAESGGNAEALLISAAVDRDGDQALDAVCTFGVIATRADTGEQYGNFLADGAWYLKVGESESSGYVMLDGWIMGRPTVITQAAFTGVGNYAIAELTASGNHVTSTGTTVVVPAKAKNPDQIRSAKAERAQGVKIAKKNYSKAKKKVAAIKNKKKRTAAKAKAKRAYKREIRNVEGLYGRRLLPTPARTIPGRASVRTPFSLSLSIDD